VGVEAAEPKPSGFVEANAVEAPNAGVEVGLDDWPNAVEAGFDVWPKAEPVAVAGVEGLEANAAGMGLAPKAFMVAVLLF
jgi:hypothetical protein